MAIYQTATYQVRLEGVEEVRRAIALFVEYVRDHEPGTRLYAAWQEHDDPTRFTHIFIFEDASAHAAHSESEAVARFESAYRPHLVGGDVLFTDFESVAMNRIP